jgi:hypothetical protein
MLGAIMLRCRGASMKAAQQRRSRLRCFHLIVVSASAFDTTVICKNTISDNKNQFIILIGITGV